MSIDVTQKSTLIFLALAAYVVVFAIGNYWLGFGQWTVHWWADIAWTVASLLTGIKCLRTANQVHGPYKRAWVLFGAACLSWFAGMLYWDYRELIRREITPFPAFSDIGYFLFAILLTLGMMSYRAEAAPASITLTQICNLGVILSAIAIAAPVVLVGAIRASTESSLYLATAVAYPVVFLAAFLFGLTCLWFYVWGANRKVFGFLLAGLAVHATTNTLYAAALLGRSYEAGNYLDVYWITGFALIYASAAMQDELDPSRPVRLAQHVGFAHGSELENIVSATAMIVVVAVLYAFRHNLQGEIVTYVFSLSLAGIGFVGLREWWAHRVERDLQHELRASFKALERNESRLAGILEIAPEGIISVDARQRIVLFNRGAERIFGYSEREVIGEPLDLLIPERFRSLHHGHVQGFAGSPASSRRMDERQEIYGLRKDGTEFPAEASLSKLEVGDERIFTVVLRDITERKKAAEALQHRIDLERIVSSISAQFINLDSERVNAAIKDALQRLGEFSQVDRGYVVLNAGGRQTIGDTHEWCAAGVEPRMGRPDARQAMRWLLEQIGRGDVVHVPRVADLPPDALPDTEELRRAAVRSLLCMPLRYAQAVIGFLGFDAVRTEKTWRTEDIRLLTLVGEIFTGVLIRRQAEETLEEQAIRDPLTNLYNRRHFNVRIQEEIAAAEQKGYGLAILACDLDNFKQLNDAQGHQAGDHVLKEVAKSITESIRGSDSAFRWGGDEMFVLLSNTSKEGILIVAERIREGVARLKTLSHGKLDISIGIALYPEHGRSADELIRLADRALYIAKKGGDKIHIGEEEYHLRDDTVRVVFQPVVDLRFKEPIGFEALSRDAQGKLGILDLFRKYQAIGLLDDLKRLCFATQLKTAQAVGIKKVFINVDFKLLGQLPPSPIPPGVEVVLEISEGEALHNVDEHLAIAKRWREQGYTFAIDDFGAGFVSLPFIARLVPEHIKMDRSTILQAVESNRFRRILKDLLLGLRNCSTDGIIAEGIESAQELAIVRELGIYLVQGYLLGKPEERRPQDSLS